MKLAFAALTVLLLFALPAHGDQIEYSLTVTNAPGVGTFSWTIMTDGYIEPPPPPIFVPTGNPPPYSEECINCDTNMFDSFVSVSEPANGDGCDITSVFAEPDSAFTTFFSPLCDGLYDSTTAGVVEQPGVTGTFSFAGTNPDGTQSLATWSVTDMTTSDDPPDPPMSTPEPSTLSLLFCGLAMAWTGWRKLGRIDA